MVKYCENDQKKQTEARQWEKKKTLFADKHLSKGGRA